MTRSEKQHLIVVARNFAFGGHPKKIRSERIKWGDEFRQSKLMYHSESRSGDDLEGSRLSDPRMEFRNTKNRG